jgi:uncharacterized membrane protein YtjA (UPF0391 family)
VAAQTPPDSQEVLDALSEIRQGDAMLHYAVVFLVIALVAALFGFGGIAASAAGIAKVLFFVFLIVAVVSFALGVMRKT